MAIRVRVNSPHTGQTSQYDDVTYGGVTDFEVSQGFLYVYAIEGNSRALLGIFAPDGWLHAVDVVDD